MQRVLCQQSPTSFSAAVAPKAFPVPRAVLLLIWGYTQMGQLVTPKYRKIPALLSFLKGIVFSVPYPVASFCEHDGLMLNLKLSSGFRNYYRRQNDCVNAELKTLQPFFQSSFARGPCTSNVFHKRNFNTFSVYLPLSASCYTQQLQ